MVSARRKASSASGRVVELDLHALPLAGGPGVGDLVGRLVDADDLGALAGQGDGVVAGAAAEVEDPLALDVAEQLQRVLPRDVGAVGHDVGGQSAPPGEATENRCMADSLTAPVCACCDAATSGRRRRSA